MTVYVDALMEHAPVYRGPDCEQAFRVGTRHGHRWCHLVTDGSPAELHAFASKIGMRRAWAQREDDPAGPHYDLTPRRRELAIRAGAVEVDRRGLVNIRRAVRARARP